VGDIIGPGRPASRPLSFLECFVIHRRVLTSGAVLVAGLLLSGCAGSASPGVAARIGDETISSSRVEQATENMCTALRNRFAEQPAPLRDVRTGVVQLLAVDAMAEQIADEYGVTPGSAYERNVGENKDFAANLPEEVRDDYVEVMSAQVLVSDVLEQVGQIKLQEQGITDGTVDQARRAGADVFTTWPNTHTYDIDPKYGLKMVDGVLESVDTDLSLAVSDLATSGAATEVDPAYTGQLALHHRCGA